MKWVLTKPRAHEFHDSCPVVFRVRVVGSSGFGSTLPEMSDSVTGHTFDWKNAKRSWASVSSDIGLVSTAESLLVSRNNAEEDTRVFMDRTIIIPGGQPAVRVVDEMLNIGKDISRVEDGKYNYNFYMCVDVEKPGCGIMCGVDKKSGVSIESPLLRVLGSSILYVRYKY